MTDLKKKAGRPRKYDPVAVLEQMTNVFWRKGYQATSVDDLCQASGLTKPSLYAGFGDKRTCFLKALEHYQQKAPQRDIGLLQSDQSAKELVRTLMLRALAGPSSDSPAGCLQVIASAEVGHLPEFQPLIAKGHEQNEAGLRELMTRAQGDGRLSADKDPAALAMHFNLVIQGLAVKQRCGHSEIALSKAVEQSLVLLD